jgi:hypothetical protein
MLNEFAIIFLFGFVLPVLLFFVVRGRELINDFSRPRTPLDSSHFLGRKDLSAFLKVNFVLYYLIPILSISCAFGLFAFSFRGTAFVFVVVFVLNIVINSLTFLVADS